MLEELVPGTVSSRRQLFPAARGSLCALLLLCVLSSVGEARAQVVVEPSALEEAPPPMKYLPPPERAALGATRDARERTRLSLEMAEARLQRASQLSEAARFAEASAELGIYQAIVEDAVGFLRLDANASNRMRDLCKRLEVTLRAHGPRIETIRRMTPHEESPNVRAAYETVRRARAEALNAFYGQTVMDEAPATPAPSKEAPGAQGAGADSAEPAAAPAPDSFARLHAAYKLIAGREHAKEALPELIALLKDGEALVRGNAAYGLGCIGPDAQAAVPALLDLLKDKNALVRYSAAEAIGKIGMAAVPALNKATHMDK